MVLHWRSGEYYPVARCTLHDGDTGLRAAVLDDVGLVEADGVPFERLQVFGGCRHEAVGRHYDVARIDLLHEFAPVEVFAHTVAVQRRCEACHLGLPVGYHACRRYHQARPLAGVCQQEGYRLHRLAQAHVIGKACSGTPCREAHHPLIALFLVGAQLGLQPLRHVGFHLFGLVYTLLEVVEVRRAPYVYLAVHNLCQQACLHGRHRCRAVLVGGDGLQTFQLPSQLL